MRKDKFKTRLPGEAGPSRSKGLFGRLGELSGSLMIESERRPSPGFLSYFFFPQGQDAGFIAGTVEKGPLFNRDDDIGKTLAI